MVKTATIQVSKLTIGAKASPAKFWIPPLTCMWKFYVPMQYIFYHGNAANGTYHKKSQGVNTDCH